ncbi:MAG: 1-acyl-sn-glycerol-3-phosphate acyltransferase [Pseudomonadota bacterium]|nr:1-acyl-sn-glycerol-3-phosphate acyltransferase [Pseudomonadota bacterium]
MIFLRSLLFNLCFFAWALLSSMMFAPLFILSARAAQHAGAPWARSSLWLARVILGIRHELRGREYLADGPFIYACKHQSAWETIIFLTLFQRPAYILKRELLRLPFWGWYLWRMKMIAIDRSAGGSSIKHMLRQAKEALADQRPIVIFPEGTRKAPGAPPAYHPGILALYSQMNVPVIPIALNSGLFWGKNAFFKRPGTIVIEFLPPIAPGLDKREFMQRLQADIETASQRLLEEGRKNHQENPCAHPDENQTNFAG